MWSYPPTPFLPLLFHWSVLPISQAPLCGRVSKHRFRIKFISFVTPPGLVCNLVTKYKPHPRNNVYTLDDLRPLLRNAFSGIGQSFTMHCCRVTVAFLHVHATMCPPPSPGSLAAQAYGGARGARRGRGEQDDLKRCHFFVTPRKFKEIGGDNIFRKGVGASQNMHQIFVYLAPFANVR